MNKRYRIIIFIIPALILLTLLLVFLYEPAFSKDQKNVIKLYGNPSQFVITYLPRGNADDPQLVRSETWYYPKLEKSISFLGGNYVSEDTYISTEEFEDTQLRPQYFDFFLTYKDLEDIFGVENIVPIDSLPVFYEKDDIATYMTDQALFIIEDDHLTYFQTIDAADNELNTEYISQNDGISNENVSLQNDNTNMDIDRDEDRDRNQYGETDDNKEDNQQNDWKTYKNSDLKMTIKYPNEWYLDDNNTVLSSYDTGYLEKGLELPEKRLKCDFFIYENSDIEIENDDEIIDDDVSVYEGYAKESENAEGPGLGDSKLFIFKQTDKDTVALLCYAYDESFYLNLLEMFETFKYTER